MLPCHYIYDEETKKKVHIPGCWASVIHGEWACSCRKGRYASTPEGFERQEFNEKMAAIKKENNELRDENARLNRVIKKLLKIK